VSSRKKVVTPLFSTQLLAASASGLLLIDESGTVKAPQVELGFSVTIKFGVEIMQAQRCRRAATLGVMV